MVMAIQRIRVTVMTEVAVNPDAVEICGDGIDQDCNGADEVCPLGTNQVDDDSDGYTENQGDCDDASALINPAAVDICGDGIDQDCSGADSLCPVDPGQRDDDGDGYSEDQGDCNDTNSAIHPKTWETCGDGIDQDCSGQDLTCPNGESAFESELRLLINQYRSDNSLVNLAYRKGLQGLAFEHNVYMAQTGDESRWFQRNSLDQSADVWVYQLGGESRLEFPDTSSHVRWVERFTRAQCQYAGYGNQHDRSSKSGAYITMLGCRIL